MKDEKRTEEQLLEELNQRRQRADELEEKIAFQMNLLNAVEQAIIATYLQGEIIFLNRFAEQLYGRSAEEAVGQNIIEVTVPQMTQEQVEEIMTTLRKGGSWQGECLVQHRDGTSFTAMVKGTPTHDAGGNPIGIIGVSSYITERKRMEAALQESEHNLLKAQRITHTGSWVWNLDTDEVACSDEMLRIWAHGPEKGSLTFQEIMGRIHPEDRTRIRRTLEKAVKYESRFEAEFRITLPDGDERVIHGMGHVKRGKRGKSPAIHVTGQDITARRQAEEALSYRVQVEKMENDIAISFVNAENSEIDEAIISALESITRFVRANRSSLFLLSDDLETITNTHEWCVSPEDSQIALLQEFPFSTFGYHREQLLQHRTVSISRLDDFPRTAKGEREWMEEHGFRSLLFIPLIKQEKLQGALGVYGGVGDEVKWLPEFLDMLRMTGNIILNVLERKQAAEALRRSEELLSIFMDSATDGFMVCDAHLNLVKINDTALRAFPIGTRKDSLIGKNIVDLVPNIRESGRYDKYLEVIQTGVPLLMDDLVPDPKFGNRYLSVKAFKAGDGMGLIRSDITERKQMEKALRRANEELNLQVGERTAELREAELRYRTVADFTYDWEYWRGRDGTLLYVSPSCERITGYTPEAFVNNEHLINEIILPDDREIWDNHRSEPAGRKELLEIQFRIRTRDGRVRWIEHACLPVTGDDGGFLGFRISNRDITERKGIEERLKKSEAHLRTLAAHFHAVQERERQAIAREMHDELGQILTAAKIDLRIIARDLGSTSVERKQLIPEIEVVIGHLDSVIKQARTLVTRLRPKILDDLGLLPALEWQLEEFGRRTTTQCALTSTLERMDLDTDRATAAFRIFQEALTNIARHAGATEVRVNLDSDGGWIRLEIADDGIGFNEVEEHDKQTFGLLGMRERAVRVGGNVEITSRKGEGTTVALAVPQGALNGPGETGDDPHINR